MDHNKTKDKKEYSSAVSLCLINTLSIDMIFNTFWKIEEPAPSKKLFTNVQKCEEHFTLTTSQDSQTRRFVVSLSFRLDPSLLGGSRKMYENLGHMKNAMQQGKYHLPHHAVVKHVFFFLP
ncbi:uncharacterized protein LOC126901564 [Daktulosphaira vitifoliae]|uniref:uncharacterized protein LOC126901564 n=1 Tax=Daktulosphaira vitifoliae TaxID=58002 RepID=UPI0021AAB4F5|nr:uncharacterized protein LOC126901564 [Daktulosphaira vitifoliae]